MLRPNPRHGASSSTTAFLLALGCLLAPAASAAADPERGRIARNSSGGWIYQPLALR